MASLAVFTYSKYRAAASETSPCLTFPQVMTMDRPAPVASPLVGMLPVSTFALPSNKDVSVVVEWSPDNVFFACDRDTSGW